MKKRILIVDDDTVVLASLRSIITQYCPDYQIIMATNGFAALDQLYKYEEVQPVDLILTDDDMPGVNGFVFAQIVRRIAPDIPIVLVSEGPVTPRFQGHVGSIHFSAHLKKPLHPEQVSKLLHNHGLTPSKSRDCIKSPHSSERRYGGFKQVFRFG